MAQALPACFVSDAGGPWPWIPQMRATFATLEASLKQMVADHSARPKAILMVSVQQKEEEAAIGGAARPPMVYDYSGFPAETCQITYSAPGSPDIATRRLLPLQGTGIAAHIDPLRGFASGLFAPMAVMYPQTDVPIFQVSMLASFGPAAHLAIGRALRPLREEGAMIFVSAVCDGWLYDAMSFAPVARVAAVLDWENASVARMSHKEEEHLVPLFSAFGAADDEEATRIYHNVNGMAELRCRVAVAVICLRRTARR